MVSNMQQLNYHHLFYFWSVANSGSVIAASDKLKVAQPTISAQLKSLEESLGVPLFVRSGRGLVLTEAGKTVHKYADDIFSLGKELLQTVQGETKGSSVQMRIGVADVFPKLLVRNALLPLFQATPDIKVICYDGKPADLLSKLALHELDLVLSDEPIGPSFRIKAFSHLLGECEVAFMVPNSLEVESDASFPDVLSNLKILLPTKNTAFRKIIDEWFELKSIHPQIVGEFEDSILIKEVACAIGAVFAVPSVIARCVSSRFPCRCLGTIPELNVPFYAISPERKVKHPGVSLITERAKGAIFGKGEIQEVKSKSKNGFKKSGNIDSDLDEFIHC